MEDTKSHLPYWDNSFANVGSYDPNKHSGSWESQINTAPSTLNMGQGNRTFSCDSIHVPSSFHQNLVLAHWLHGIHSTVNYLICLLWHLFEGVNTSSTWWKSCFKLRNIKLLLFNVLRYTILATMCTRSKPTDNSLSRVCVLWILLLLHLKSCKHFIHA